MKKLIKSFKNLISSEKGFTLIEMVTAIAVLMIAMSMIAPAFYANASAESKTMNIRRARETVVGHADTIFNSIAKPSGGPKNYTVTFSSGAIQVSGNTYEQTQDGYTFGVVVAG